MVRVQGARGIMLAALAMRIGGVMAELPARSDQARSLLEAGSESARMVRRKGFRALLGGEQVAVEELATRGELKVDAACQALADLQSKGLARLEAEGRLVGGRDSVSCPRRIVSSSLARRSTRGVLWTPSEFRQHLRRTRTLRPHALTAGGSSTWRSTTGV